MKFTVVIEREGGQREERVIEAESRFAVYANVQREGGTVISFKEKSNFNPLAWLTRPIGLGVSRRELVIMTKNLSAMLAAGLPLSRALEVIEKQSPGTSMRTVAASVGASVRKGSSFHDALAEHPHVFSGLMIAMTKAGEESGSLAKSLAVTSLQMERSLELSRKITGALIYPAIVLATVIVGTILMLTYVVPTLTSTFAEMRIQLPLVTQIIVATSSFFVANMVAVICTLIIIILLAVLFFRSRAGGTTGLWVALRIPIIGELVRESYAARTARTLSSLLASGVPVLSALAITREVVRAGSFTRVVAEAEARVKKGEPMSSAFSAHKDIYPAMMSEMLAVGEETGTVAEMLQQVADFYESEVADKTKDLSALIEPLLMLLIGTMVGIFAIAMIAPIYSLSSAI